MIAESSNDRDLGPAIEAAYEASDKVFIGTAIKNVADSSTIIFHINKWFKGGDEEKIIMSCKTHCSSESFDVSAQYLVYANDTEAKNTLSLYHDKTVTKLKLKADLDIELLNDMSLPFRENDDSAWWFDE